MAWDLGEHHKPNHNSYALYYHTVFVTHKREPLVSRQMAGFLSRFFQDKGDALEVRPLEQGILSDHVHLILSLRPTHYIPEVLNYLKGTSAHDASRYHDFRNTLRWMRGYRIHTVSQRDLPSARQYVRDQHKHHPDRIPD